MHETYLQDMNSKYVYPNVFMSIDDTNKVSQYDTDIKKYAEQKKADWILHGGIEKDGTLPDSMKNHSDHSSIRHMGSHEKPVCLLLLSAFPVHLHIF